MDGSTLRRQQPYGAFAIIGFGLSTNLWLALMFLALAGAADMVSGNFRMMLWNQTIPARLRGRTAAIEMVSYSSGPYLGNEPVDAQQERSGRGS